MAADKLYPDFLIKQNYPEFSFSGSGWTKDQTDNSGHNTSGLHSFTSTAGESVTISPSMEFTDAVVFGYAAKDAGLMNIYVDGVLNGQADGYIYLDSSNTMKNAALYWIKGIPRGTHTIKLECAGQKNSLSTGNKIGVQHIIVLNPNYPVEQKINSVLFVGDSISDSSTSYCDAGIKGVVGNLQGSTKLRYEYSTRPGISSGLANFVENEIVAKRPSYVSVMLGTNDLGAGTTQDTRGNIEKIITACKNQGVSLQFCTIPPRNGMTAGLYNDINNTIRELCGREGIPVVDFNKIVFNNTAGTTTPMKSDGIHPDNVGHSLMTRELFNTLITQKTFRKILFS